ncbi:Rve-domain-containing hypothetical protein [Phytophthora megakarya]|uniref:Integrase catalytic domain-containing protein n=1 Tax=Phytophthora megakarya TaxID=4795 RepID=A0A225X3E0_9STRA|nr:Rve-domain-containing hypothetical protein [Phytophthora megakarya]
MPPFREDLFAFEGMVSGIEVTIADGMKLRVAGRKTVKLTGVNGKRITMMEVLYIPGLNRRLLSVGKRAERGLTVEFQRSSCMIWGTTCAIETGTKIGKAYVPDCEQEEARFVEFAGADSQWGRWHARMGHPNENATIKTQRSTNGYFLKNKSAVTTKLTEFKAFYEMQWGERLKCLQSDNGTEYVNKRMAAMCSRNAIMHQRTVPYSPQQNGVAESMNRTIMEKVRSMLYYKGVPTMWWAEAVVMAVYLINRSTNAAHSDVTPYELRFKVKPGLEHFRVFGSQGYAHIDDAKRTKLEVKGFRCLFCWVYE